MRICALLFLFALSSVCLGAPDKKHVLSTIEKSAKKSCTGNTLGMLILDERTTLVPPFPERTRKENNEYLRGLKERVLGEESLRMGMEFILAHKKQLADVEKKYRVDRHTLAGLFRMESDFGQEKGIATPASGVYTLYVKGRKKTALLEIRALCRLMEKQGFDPHSISASPAGAFGLPQFMPSAYIDFGTDGNGDGRVDLFTWEDAIPSAAHFLNKKKFHKNPREALIRYNRWGFYADLILSYRSEIKRYEQKHHAHDPKPPP